MKRRQPPKGRNLVAKAMHESKLFASKVVPAKKGKGFVYSRKSRDAIKGLSGSYLLVQGQLNRFLCLICV